MKPTRGNLQHVEMKRSPLSKVGKGESAKAKVRIQAIIRQIRIILDGGCVLRESSEVGPCSGWNKEGELVLQYDHLVTRGRNISYADTRLGVILCKGHHGGFKKWHKERYDKIVRVIIGPKRAELWDKVEADRRTYPMGIYEWTKQEIALKDELKVLQAA